MLRLSVLQTEALRGQYSTIHAHLGPVPEPLAAASSVLVLSPRVNRLYKRNVHYLVFCAKEA